MESPKKITSTKPVKLIFAGGFLGSGKTTALAGLAKRLIQRGHRVGIITNDQTENLVDTAIVTEMLRGMGVPVEEVVKGCFCCKFDELIEGVEKVLAHDPDVIMGEPVGSCTDFVAAVANPIKIHYRDTFKFAPFSIMVDPERLRELLLGETDSLFPEEVAYLFRKQLEEADVIVLNKVDLIAEREATRLKDAIQERFAHTRSVAISAKQGDGVDEWLDLLLSGIPGANKVLRELDYDRYATAEAVLGWLNAAVKLASDRSFDPTCFLRSLAEGLKEEFKRRNAEIGHLKFVLTSSGKAIWANITHLAAAVSLGGEVLGEVPTGSLIINARVRMPPEDLEGLVRERLHAETERAGLIAEILELQCFSPAYPQPPYLLRETIA
ncbi:MAG: GTP-binding protein [bacterium]